MTSFVNAEVSRYNSPSRARSSTIAALLVQRAGDGLRIVELDRRMLGEHVGETPGGGHDDAAVDQVGHPGCATVSTVCHRR